MSSVCPRGCRGCCTSSARRPAWNRAWPNAGRDQGRGGPSLQGFRGRWGAARAAAQRPGDVARRAFESTGRRGGGYVVTSPVTALVGRDRDVGEVVSLLGAQERRLVVLTGAGGVGKTRLALAVLDASRPHWADGVAFVDLSSVTDPRLVPEAIAAALGFVGQGRERPLDTLGRRLGGRRILVVLDNFEQVVDGAPVVADLLQRGPRLHVLVTSRVVLRVRGEQQWRVDPLPVSPAGADPAALAQAPAVRLFVDRVRDVSPGFGLTNGNAAAAAELCRRLDGLPLALELAAGWMRLLTPEQMLQRLDERMGRRGGPAGPAPPPPTL